MGRKIFLALLAAATVVCIVVGLCVHTGLFRNGFRIGIDGSKPVISFNEQVKTEVLYSVKDSAARGNSGVKIPEDLTAVEINADIMDVEILLGDEIYIEYTGADTYRPAVSAAGSRLIITQKPKNMIGIHLSGFENRLLIKLPESIDPDTVKIETDTGDIRIEDRESGRFDLESDTGSISLQNCTASGSKVKTDTGKVMMENFTAGTLEIRTSTGGVEMKNMTSETTGFRTDTGSVRVENCDLGELTGKTDTGAVNLNSCSFKNTDLETDTGSVEISSLSKQSEYSLDLESDTGSITVNGEKLKGKYRLEGGKYRIKIETDTGRITLEGV